MSILAEDTEMDIVINVMYINVEINVLTNSALQ